MHELTFTFSNHVFRSWRAFRPMGCAREFVELLASNLIGQFVDAKRKRARAACYDRVAQHNLFLIIMELLPLLGFSLGISLSLTFVSINMCRISNPKYIMNSFNLVIIMLKIIMSKKKTEKIPFWDKYTFVHLFQTVIGFNVFYVQKIKQWT